MDDQDLPRPSADRPRRRTALVTSRWAASAAVLAAMTTGAALPSDPDASDDEASATAYADPPSGPDLV